MYNWTTVAIRDMMHVVIAPKVWVVKVRICWNRGCPMFGQVLVGLSSWNPSGTGWQVGSIRSKLLVGFPVSFQGILLCNNALHWLTSGMHTPCNACLRISQLQVTKRSCSPKKLLGVPAVFKTFQNLSKLMITIWIQWGYPWKNGSLPPEIIIFPKFNHHL